jgi:16S rRNA (cytidine1402-2'-O)-methyltransferase
LRREQNAYKMRQEGEGDMSSVTTGERPDAGKSDDAADGQDARVPRVADALVPRVADALVPSVADPVVRRVADALAGELARRPAAGLYLVATPIGHLADVTLRALAVLAGVDVVYCEDTRHSRTLLAHYALSTPLESYHDHNAAEQRPHILARLAAGAAVALVSDAGTPLVSDPGFKLVRDAAAAGYPVYAIPGPSALLAGLSVSGLPTDAFHFAGFLPPRAGPRRARLAELRQSSATLVLFEAPQRLADCLSDIADTLGDPPVAVARELTKRFEDVRRGRASELARHYTHESPRGEIVLVVGPAAAPPLDDAALDERLRAALETASLRDAADAVAAAFGIPRKRAYERALALRANRREPPE